MLSHHDLAVLAGQSYLGPWSGGVALDCHYDLLPRDDEVIVVMPGTRPTDLLDWMRDFNIAPIWLGGLGFVHAGFGSGGEALYARVSRSVAGDTRLTTIVGHSLGGAMALIVAALFLARQPGVPVRCVVFGAPRVGFCNPWLGAVLRRGRGTAIWARRGDIVPGVPSLPPYNHPARRRAIGTAVAWPSPADIAADADVIAANHSIARYAADLATLGI